MTAVPGDDDPAEAAEAAVEALYYRAYVHRVIRDGLVTVMGMLLYGLCVFGDGAFLVLAASWVPHWGSALVLCLMAAFIALAAFRYAQFGRLYWKDKAARKDMTASERAEDDLDALHTMQREPEPPPGGLAWPAPASGAGSAGGP